MKLVESILTKNPCYTAGRKITIKGLMLHSVGCAQPSASVFINNWNSASFDSACVHGFIDANDGTVYQTLPWDHRGWHAGGAANNTHIGVEMCEPACIKYTGGVTFTCSNTDEARACAQRTYNSAVELFAMLCEKFNLDPLGDGVIISHAEGAKRGVASNHGDPDHLWRQLGMNLTMDTFRKDVKAKMGNKTIDEKPTKPEEKEVLYRVRKTWADSRTQKGAYKVLANAKACADKNEGYSVFDESGKTVYSGKNSEPKKTSFRVKVSIPDLNIRKGPGTNYLTTGSFTGVGVFTIVDVKDGKGASTGWGKLKGGAGWISLDHANEI